MDLDNIYKNDNVAIYQVASTGLPLKQYIASTPESRAICNDSTVAGLEYTEKLQTACTAVLKAMNDLELLALREVETTVVQILRGGLNFGLRAALGEALKWNNHSTSFLSAQRVRPELTAGAWQISENSYRKLYFTRNTSLVLGDVVATGTSLKYAFHELLQSARQEGVQIKSVVFFTYGGAKATEICNWMDENCRRLFPNFQGVSVIFLEGIFTVGAANLPLRICLPDTDLLRYKAQLSPEFMASQFENPAYPLERCAIYDAGARAFCVPEYVYDVLSYWKQILEFAQSGTSYKELLNERFPQINAARFDSIELKQVAEKQIEQVSKLLK